MKNIFQGIKLYYIILVLSIIPLLFSYIRDSYDWEGDTALMLRQAENIAHHQNFYESEFLYNPSFPILSPPFYPPLTPALFSVIYKINGHHIPSYLVLESVLFALAFFLLFHFLRKKIPPYFALGISLFLAYNQYIFPMKLEIMSDLLFFNLFVLSLLSNEIKNRNKYVLLGLLSALTLACRSVAYALIIAITLDLLIPFFKSDRKKTDGLSLVKNLSLFGIPFLLMQFIIRYFFPAPQNGIEIYINILQNIHWESILFNAENNFVLIKNILISPLNGWPILSWIATISFFILVGLGFKKLDLRKWSLSWIFTFIYLSILIIYPYHQAGARFLLPIIYFFAIAFIFGVQSLLQWFNKTYLSKTIWALLIVIQLIILTKGQYNFADRIKNNPSEISKKEFKDMISEIKQNVDSSEVIAFAYPRMLSFYSRRKAFTFAPNATTNTIFNEMKAFNARYILISERFSYPSYEKYVQNNSKHLKLLWENEGYRFYRFQE